MRSSPIVHALVTPKISGGMSSGVTAVLYGAAAIAAFFAFSWHPWAVVGPFAIAAAFHVYFKAQFKKDPYYRQIKRVYDTTADCYQPWAREDLRGRGKRPKGYGRGVRY